MNRTLQSAAFVIGLCGLALPSFAAEPAPALDCASRLKQTQDSKALAEVKLEEENERADAQIYLTRLELSVTKKKLADALAKCGDACKVGPSLSGSQ